MITVIGLDGSALPTIATQRLADATLVVGGERHLAAVDLPPAVRRIVLGDVRAAVTVLVAHPGNGVVLASGDPGFFGIVRRLRAEGLTLEVHPAVSSVALAFARVGVEWDDARVVSAHGRDPRSALAVVRAGGKVAVLTDGRTGPREVAAAARSGARVVVAERLGEPDERILCATAQQVAERDDWREPNVVLLLDDGPPNGPPWLAGRPGAAAPWALPDDAFVHRDAMVTKAEVRAVALSHLAPRLGDLIWDVGAGCGSVGIECARLGAAVCCVEKDDTCFIEANATAFGVDVHVVRGTAPPALKALPAPDAVFVGGGGGDVADIVRACVTRGPRTVVVALATLDRLTAVRAALSPYDVDGVLLQASRLRDLGGASALSALNPVLLVWGSRP